MQVIEGDCELVEVPDSRPHNIYRIASDVVEFKPEARMMVMPAYAITGQNRVADENRCLEMGDTASRLDEELEAFLSQINQEAYEALESAIAIGGPEEVMKCLRDAREFIGISNKNPKDAIQAFDHTDRALDECCILYNIYEKIQIARNLLRDTIILRVQCQVPMGDRSMYIAELQEMIGRIVAKSEFGRLMHSYKMTIGKKFPLRAFISNAQRDRRRRRGRQTRPKKDKSRRDVQRPQDIQDQLMEEVAERVFDY